MLKLTVLGVAPLFGDLAEEGVSEAFDPEQSPPEYPRLVEQLNEVLTAAHQLIDDKKEALQKAGFLSLNAVCMWHSTEAGTDFKAFVTRQKNLFQHNP